MEYYIDPEDPYVPRPVIPNEHKYDDIYNALLLDPDRFHEFPIPKGRSPKKFCDAVRQRISRTGHLVNIVRNGETISARIIL